MFCLPGLYEGDVKIEGVFKGGLLKIPSGIFFLDHS